MHETKERISVYCCDKLTFDCENLQHSNGDFVFFDLLLLINS